MTMEDMPGDDTPGDTIPDDCNDIAFLTDFESTSLPGEETELVREQVARPTFGSTVSRVKVRDVFNEVPRLSSH